MRELKLSGQNKKILKKKIKKIRETKLNIHILKIIFYIYVVFGKKIKKIYIVFCRVKNKKK